MAWFKFYLLMMLSFCSLIQAQDLVTKYSPFLPKIVIENKDINDGINESLQRSAAISPFLITEEINYIDNYFNKKILKPDENGRNNIKKLQTYYLAEESHWADSILQIIKKADLHYLVRNRLADAFSDAYDKDIRYSDNLTIPEPTNRDYYFAYSYLCGNTNPEYNSSNDYLQLTQKEAARISSELNREVEFFSNMNDNEQEEFFNKIIKYHYLFTDKRFNASLNIPMNELIAQAYKNTYKSRSSFALEAAYSLGKFLKSNLPGEFTYTLPLSSNLNNTKYYTWHYPYNAEMSLQYSIGFNYAYSIKDYDGWLNYIKIGAQYAKFTNEYTSLNYRNIITSWTYYTGMYAAYEHNYSATTPGSINAYMLNGYIAAPLIYIYNNLHLETGVMLNFKRITASHFMNIQDIQVDTIRTLLKTEVIDGTQKINVTEASFLFNVIFNILPNADLTIRTIIGKSIAIMAGTDIKFNF